MGKYLDNHGNEQTFRAWLLSQLRISRWSVLKRETVAEAAKRLGVQEDILHEAITQRESDERRVPRQILEQRKVKIWIPIEVSKDWNEYCRVASIQSGALLRSLIAHYLANPVTTPAMLAPRWIYRGKRYLTRQSTRYAATCRVPRGAQQALDERARQLGVSTAMVVKGIVLDLLEGRTKRVMIVMTNEMSGDAKRYLEPELFRDT